MADSKLSALSSAGALETTDEFYLARSGGSYKTTLADLTAAIGGEFDGIVDVYADLPVDGTAVVGEIWLVRESSGTWLISRKQRGLYQRIDDTGTRDTDWQYLGEWLEEFSDANFSIYNGSDNSKVLAFDLSGITTATKRTLTVPNASGTLVLNDNTATLTNKTWNGVAIGVGYGGTGLASYAVGDLLQASASTTLAKLAAVATGNVLISGGVTTVSTWGKVGLTTHVSGTLAAANGGTGLASYTIGDLVYASGTTALSKLAAVAAGQVLVSAGTGTAPAWSANPTVTGNVAGTSLSATGGIATTGASRITLDYSSGARILGWGVNTSTPGTITLAVANSDASGYAAIGVVSSTGLAVTGEVSSAGSSTYGGGAFALLGAGASHGIYTLATGSPTIYFDHRAASNTGSFSWRNGTGGASTLMTLTSTGLAVTGVVTTSAPAGGTAAAAKHGIYHAGAPSATGYIEEERGGVLYKVLVST